MADYKISFHVDDKSISKSKIEKIERDYYDKVFNLFYQNNFFIRFRNKDLFEIEAHAISLKNAQLALAQTKQEIGQKQLFQMFKPQMAKSDNIWNSILKDHKDQNNISHSEIKVQVDNLSLLNVLMFNRRLRMSNSIYWASLINPSYYYLKVKDVYDPYIVAGTGMNDLPTYFYTKSFHDHNDLIEHADGIDFVVYKQIYLTTSNIDTHIKVIIQIGRTKDGFQMKLDLYAPDFIPQNEFDNYKNRILISIKNMAQLASNETLNPVQKLFLNRVYIKMKNN